MQKVIIIDDKFIGERLDTFLSRKIEDMSRSRIQKLLKEGQITANGKRVKASYKLQEKDTLRLVIPEPQEIKISPKNIPIDILYEDEQILVINKPQGMVVHPAPGNYNNTLVNALLYHCKNLSNINDVLRPGIVHRIDKDTSGILVVAKTDIAHQNLAEQMKAYTVKRIYEALVHGIIDEPEGMVDAPIGRDQVNRKRMAVKTGGKEAITHYKVLERFKEGYTLVEARLETGRTHQIRVHMAYMKHPVVGDPKYGPKKPHFKLTGQLLHAKTLAFKHPITKKHLEFTAPLPKTFQNILKKLRFSGAYL